MKRLTPPALIVLILGLLLLSACDDDSVAPENFSVTLNVRDGAGDPVQGLYLTLLNDTSFLQDLGAKETRAAVAIQFTVPLACHVALTVEDLEGRTVRDLVGENLPAGEHRVMWNGLDDQQRQCYSGRYTFRLIASDAAGTRLFEDTTDALMALLSVDVHNVGATNSAGELKLTDKTLFPHLYARDPMMSHNENGEELGVIDLSARMRFYLRDPVSGITGLYYRDVERSGQVIDIVWRGGDAPPAPAAMAGPPSGSPDKPVDPVPAVFRLRPAYPNPFN